MNSKISILILIQLIIALTVYGFSFQFLESPLNKKSILFTRHGARSPTKYSEVDAKQWGQFPPGYLTNKGLQQHIQLGSKFRDSQLYDEDENCDYESIHIESSTSQRVMVSTIGFVRGLCPNNYGDILYRLFNEYYLQFSTNQENLDAILSSNFTNPLDYNYEGFQRERDFLFHGHDGDVCPVLDKIDEKVESSDAVLKKTEEFKAQPEFEEVFEVLQKQNPSKNITRESVTINNMKTLYGNYRCDSTQGFSQPQLSNDAIEYLKKVFKFKFYRMDNSQEIQHQSSTSEIFRWVIQEMYSDNPLSWYSGHDSNQVAILSVITDYELILPFAGFIELEIKGDYVNLYYEGARVKTKFCDIGINCPKKLVEQYLRKYIVDDLDALCSQVIN